MTDADLLRDVPFVDGIDWAAPFIDEDNQGPKPEMVGDVLALGDVIWLEDRDGKWLLAEVPRIEGALARLDPAGHQGRGRDTVRPRRAQPAPRAQGGTR